MLSVVPAHTMQPLFTENASATAGSITETGLPGACTRLGTIRYTSLVATSHGGYLSAAGSKPSLSVLFQSECPICLCSR